MLSNKWLKMWSSYQSGLVQTIFAFCITFKLYRQLLPFAGEGGWIGVLLIWIRVHKINSHLKKSALYLLHTSLHFKAPTSSTKTLLFIFSVFLVQIGNCINLYNSGQFLRLTFFLQTSQQTIHHYVKIIFM